MKKLMLIAAGMATLVACTNKPTNEFAINGTTDLADGETIYLVSHISKDSVYTDSAVVAEGKFAFLGDVETPVQAVIYTGKTYVNNPQMRSIVLEPAVYEMSITGDSYRQAPVSGSFLTAQMDTLDNIKWATYAEMDTLRKQMRAAGDDDEKIRALGEQYDKAYRRLSDSKIEFLKTHPSSPVSPMVMASTIYYLDLDELKEIYNSWTPEIQALDPNTAERITILESVLPGKPAPEIAGKDQNNEDVSLSGLKGKVVLVDFWATWCGPCRASFPHVKEIYDKYHDKGLEVLCVSLDREEEPWLKYIADNKDGIAAYHHVYERGCFWDSKDAKKYGVMAIPTKYLIDAEGNIVADVSSDEVLNEKLAEIFD